MNRKIALREFSFAQDYLEAPHRWNIWALPVISHANVMPNQIQMHTVHVLVEG